MGNILPMLILQITADADSCRCRFLQKVPMPINWHITKQKKLIFSNATKQLVANQLFSNSDTSAFSSFYHFINQYFRKQEQCIKLYKYNSQLIILYLTYMRIEAFGL